MNFIDGYSSFSPSYSEEMDKAHELLKQLDIPVMGNTIDPRVIYRILTDKNKCEVLIKKLKNRAFW